MGSVVFTNSILSRNILNFISGGGLSVQGGGFILLRCLVDNSATGVEVGAGCQSSCPSLGPLYFTWSSPLKEEETKAEIKKGNTTGSSS